MCMIQTKAMKKLGTARRKGSVCFRHQPEAAKDKKKNEPQQQQQSRAAVEEPKSSTERNDVCRDCASAIEMPTRHQSVCEDHV